MIKNFIMEMKNVFLAFKEEYVPIDSIHEPNNNLKSIPESTKTFNYQTNSLRISILKGIKSPLRVQRYFLLWMFHVLYTVLKFIVLVPFQIVIGLMNCILKSLNICHSQRITFFSTLLVISTYIFLNESLQFFDISFLYHTFRGQSTIKLYGLIFAFEVSQKLLTMVEFRLKAINIEIWKLMPQLLSCFCYTIIHAFSIYLQYNVFIVIINSSMSNFWIFAFVTNLTKMKSNAFKKFEINAYKTQISFDAKDRFQKIVYIILFRLSQSQRHVTDFTLKLFIIFVMGSIIEQIKHITILTLSGKIQQLKTVTKQLYDILFKKQQNLTTTKKIISEDVEQDKSDMMKSFNIDFTVIPFTVFVLKMSYIILKSVFNGNLSYQTFIQFYLVLVIITILVKICTIIIKVIFKEQLCDSQLKNDMIQIQNKQDTVKFNLIDVKKDDEGLSQRHISPSKQKNLDDDYFVQTPDRQRSNKFIDTFSVK